MNIYKQITRFSTKYHHNYETIMYGHVHVAYRDAIVYTRYPVRYARCFAVACVDMALLSVLNGFYDLSTHIGSASLARSIRIRFHFRHRTGRIRSVSDHRAGRVWWSRHRSKPPNCLPGARDQVPALFRNAIERRGASVDPNSGAPPITKSTFDVATHGHYWTDDCINMKTRITIHYFKCNRMENDNILLSHTCTPANWHAH